MQSTHYTLHDAHYNYKQLTSKYRVCILQLQLHTTIIQYTRRFMITKICNTNYSVHIQKTTATDQTHTTKYTQYITNYNTHDKKYKIYNTNYNI